MSRQYRHPLTVIVKPLDTPAERLAKVVAEAKRRGKRVQNMWRTWAPVYEYDEKALERYYLEEQWRDRDWDAE